MINGCCPYHTFPFNRWKWTNWNYGTMKHLKWNEKRTFSPLHFHFQVENKFSCHLIPPCTYKLAFAGCFRFLHRFICPNEKAWKAFLHRLCCRHPHFRSIFPYIRWSCTCASVRRLQISSHVQPTFSQEIFLCTSSEDTIA